MNIKVQVENAGIVETYGSLAAGELCHRNIFLDGDGKFCYVDEGIGEDADGNDAADFFVIRRNGTNDYTHWKYYFDKGDGGVANYEITPYFATYYNGYGYGIFRTPSYHTFGSKSVRRYTFYIFKFDFAGNIISNWLIDEEQIVLYPDFYLYTPKGYREGNIIYFVYMRRERQGVGDDVTYRYWTFDLSTETLTNRVDFVKKRYYTDSDLLDSGTAESGTSQSLTDTDKSWATNEYQHEIVYIANGTGAGQSGFISSNTATRLSNSAPWDISPDNTSEYVILKSFSFYPIHNIIKQGDYIYTLSDRKVGTNDYRPRIHIIDTADWSEAYWDDIAAVNSRIGNNGTMMRIKDGKVYALIPVRDVSTGVVYPIEGITVGTPIELCNDLTHYYSISKYFLFFDDKVLQQLYEYIPDVANSEGTALVYKVYDFDGNKRKENDIKREDDTYDIWYEDFLLDESGWGVFSSYDADWNTILNVFKITLNKPCIISRIMRRFKWGFK